MNESDMIIKNIIFMLFDLLMFSKDYRKVKQFGVFFFVVFEGGVVLF